MDSGLCRVRLEHDETVYYTAQPHTKLRQKPPRADHVLFYFIYKHPQEHSNNTAINPKAFSVYLSIIL